MGFGVSKESSANVSGVGSGELATACLGVMIHSGVSAKPIEDSASVGQTRAANSSTMKGGKTACQ